MSLTPSANAKLDQVIAPSDKLTTVWHSIDIAQAIALLESDREQGLSTAQVKERRVSYGLNELSGKKGKSVWWRFLLQFNQPLLYILLAAGATKAILGEWVNAGVIWGVTTTNAIIGFVQESKAEGAIAALAKSITTEATIIRDGQKLRIASRELVPGDLSTLR